MATAWLWGRPDLISARMFFFRAPLEADFFSGITYLAYAFHYAVIA